MENDKVHTSILKMSEEDAFNFFLDEENYCDIKLPQYFRFENLLKAINNLLSNMEEKELIDLHKIIKGFKNIENINHFLYSNKEGRYTWRPMEIIHPVLYILMLKEITSKDNWELLQRKFNEFQSNHKIKCLSIPVESINKKKNKATQISKWWEEVEQESIKSSLDYNYLYHTDISDCYPSIYTHTISWAIHGRDVAKKNRTDNNLLGNNIDFYLQCMHYGQTNGIPQGSVLMDFIAEMILGYADKHLSEAIERERISDYKILRYRDDYRIFVNNPIDGEKILKLLTEILLNLSLKINPIKTSESKQIINSSIKSDKYEWIIKKQEESDIQKQLLIIHNHGIKYTNSGSLLAALVKFYNRLHKIKNEKIKNPVVLISIVTDIAYNSPRTIPHCFSIISKLLSFTNDTDENIRIIEKIHKKFLQMPNSGFTEVWLQRVSYPIKPQSIVYNEKLCRIVENEDECIWYNEWAKFNDLKYIISSKKIVNNEYLEKISKIIKPNEIDIFQY